MISTSHIERLVRQLDAAPAVHRGSVEARIVRGALAEAAWALLAQRQLIERLQARLRAQADNNDRPSP